MNSKKFSGDFKKAIARFSQSTGVEEETLLEAVFLKYLAEGNTRQRVWGPHDQVCFELVDCGDGKYLKGHELYQHLEKHLINKFTQERIAELTAKRRKSGLTAVEKEWLADHRAIVEPVKVKKPVKINHDKYHKAGAERALMLQKIERAHGIEAAQKWADENPFPVLRYIGK